MRRATRRQTLTAVLALLALAGVLPFVRGPRRRRADASGLDAGHQVMN
jgi:hypothetical protein